MRPPGYSFFLAGVFAVFGESYLAVRLIQAVLDTAVVGLMYSPAARLALRKPVVAAWIAALCPFTAIYTTYILSETLSIFLAALSLNLLIETARRPRSSTSAFSGAALGALILVRPDFGLLPPVAFLFWLLVKRSRRSFLKLSAVATFTCLPLFAPWVVRNYMLFRDLNVAATVVMVPAEADMLRPKGFWSWFRHGPIELAICT